MSMETSNRAGPHSGTKPLAYAPLGDIQRPNPCSPENSLLLFPGLSCIAHISKGQHYKMSWLWVAVSRNSKDHPQVRYLTGRPHKSAGGFPLVDDLFQWKGTQRSQQQRRAADGAKFRRTRCTLAKCALPMKSPAYLKLSQHRPTTARVKYCLLGKLTGD